jgi:hypothetical protein
MLGVEDLITDLNDQLVPLLVEALAGMIRIGGRPSSEWRRRRSSRAE